MVPMGSKKRLGRPDTTPLEPETSANLPAHSLTSSFPETLSYLTSTPVDMLLLQPRVPSPPFDSFPSLKSLLFLFCTCAIGGIIYPLRMVQWEGDITAVI